MPTILITGGSGYIGKHVCSLLLENNYDIVVIDNEHNSKLSDLDDVKNMSGKNIKTLNIDITDSILLDNLFNDYGPFDTVVHLAALKSVTESDKNPDIYQYINVFGGMKLIGTMKKYNCRNIIFSSTSAVYGNVDDLPITTDHETHPLSVYGKTKLIFENILECSGLNVIIFRFFNVIGAHPSGKIGENCNGLPKNLLPVILDVIDGKLPYLNIYGDDWNTHDGTCVRDYIHVMDIANAHLKALKNMKSGINIYNLSTGTGYSVHDIVNEMKKISNKEFKVVISDKRPGEAECIYAIDDNIESELGWKSEYNLADMCTHAWNYHTYKNQ